MDFFAQQDRARARTGRLLALYALAVLGVVVTLNVIGATIWGATRHGVDPMFHLLLTLGIGAVIGIATLIKQGEIGGDGAKVAESLGGRPIVGTPGDLNERKLLNVVEEMSLASGVPMPRVYVMDDESGINAFAAGTRPDNAVVAVTRGTLERLNRDELQGVVAHEFSHILNGDMRLNLRLIVLNFGLLAIGFIGLQILRFSPNRSYGRRDDRRDNGAGAIVLFAIAMAILGYVGTLFGKILQAAVSRQREYLADASAVQFTRNPNGIASALKKIGGIGSTLQAPNATEASHLFFADGVSGFLDSLFATHPPLAKRIQAIDPTFKGEIESRASAALVEGVSGFAAEPPSLSRNVPLPIALRDAVRDPFDARAIALATLIERDPQLRRKQFAAIASTDAKIVSLLEKYEPAIAPLAERDRLSLVELAVPALHGLSTTQTRDFRKLCRALAAADDRFTPFEVALLGIIEQSLPDNAGPDVSIGRVDDVTQAAGILLSALAHAGGEEQARRAFDAGVAHLGTRHPIPFVETYDPRAFGNALAVLRATRSIVRARLVDAATKVVNLDGETRPAEYELMRATCAAFGFNVPPLAGRASA